VPWFEDGVQGHVLTQGATGRWWDLWGGVATWEELGHWGVAKWEELGHWGCGHMGGS
jgi:hypothetical protein